MQAAVLCLILFSVCLAEKTLHLKNELKDTPEEKVDIVMSQVEQYCQSINSDRLGLRRKRDVDSAFRYLVLQAVDDCDDGNGGDANPTEAPIGSSEMDPCISYATRNLTESWRLENRGTAVRPDHGMYACDRSLQGNAIWFRFAGSAGHQLANRCAPAYSCGSHGGFWSDADMPSVTGQIKEVPIYGSWSGNCKWYTWPTANALTVKRCSDRAGDFVYKVRGTSSCYWAFCGMTLAD